MSNKLSKSQQRQSIVDAYNRPPEYMQKLKAALNRGADQHIPEVMQKESDVILEQAGVNDEDGMIAQMKMENIRKKMIGDQRARSIKQMQQIPQVEVIPAAEVYSADEPDDEIEIQRQILRKRAGY